MTAVTAISEHRGVVTGQMAQSRSAEQAASVTGCAIVSAPREGASALITRAAGNAATNVASVSRHQSIMSNRRGQSQNSTVYGQSDPDGLLGENTVGVTISRHQTGGFSLIPVSSDVTDFELSRTTFSVASGARSKWQSVAPPEVCASSEVGLVGVAGPTSLFPFEPIARPPRSQNIVFRSLDNEVELTS